MPVGSIIDRDIQMIGYEESTLLGPLVVLRSLLCQ